MLYGGHGERPALLPVFPSQGTEAVFQAIAAVAARPSRPSLDEDCAAVDVMLRFSDRLLQAYALKEAFYHFMDAPTARPLCGVSTSGSTPATRLRTSRIQILPQDVAQLEALHTQRFRFSPVQWVYRGLQQRNQDTQKSRLRVQKLPFLQDEDSALAGPLPQHLTKSLK